MKYIRAYARYTKSFRWIYTDAASGDAMTGRAGYLSFAPGPTTVTART